MKHYKSNTGEVFAYEDEYPVPLGLVEMTDSELREHINPDPIFADEYAVLSAAHRLNLEECDKAYLTAIRADGPNEVTRQQEIRELADKMVEKFEADVIALMIKHGMV